MITEKPNLLNDNEPDFNHYGDLEYTREQLLKMEGYFSDDDPESLEMPFMTWSIREQKLVLYMKEDPEITDDNNPYEAIDIVPESIELNKDSYDDGNIYFITVPLETIDHIHLESRDHHYEDYELPEEYRFEIYFEDGRIMKIKGEYDEYTPDGGSLPESWFFRHNTRIVTK